MQVRLVSSQTRELREGSERTLLQGQVDLSRSEKAEKKRDERQEAGVIIQIVQHIGGVITLITVIRDYTKVVVHIFLLKRR